jgi:hypothetical protein
LKRQIPVHELDFSDQEEGSVVMGGAVAKRGLFDSRACDPSQFRDRLRWLFPCQVTSIPEPLTLIGHCDLLSEPTRIDPSLGGGYGLPELPVWKRRTPHSLYMTAV